MSALSSRLQSAMAAGLGYLLSCQAEDGSWTDWALPPGSSSAWTTAYVGYQLRHLPAELSAVAAPHVVAAARWLDQAAFPDGGWGYNEVVGLDGDSTSYAILCLASAGWRPPDSAYVLLAGLQRADGGFATYPPFGERNSWNVSHPDVTPVALLALLTHPAPDRAAIRAGIDYVLRQRTPEGLWNSFWWDSCLYATAASLAVLAAVGIETPPSANLARMEPTHAFERALLASALLHAGPNGRHAMIGDLAASLVDRQEPDGSWPCAPILRVTRRDCYEPWAYPDSGQVYADPHRLFTTATVLATLAKVRASLDR